MVKGAGCGRSSRLISNSICRLRHGDDDPVSVQELRRVVRLKEWHQYQKALQKGKKLAANAAACYFLTAVVVKIYAETRRVGTEIQGKDSLFAVLS